MADLITDYRNEDNEYKVLDVPNIKFNAPSSPTPPQQPVALPSSSDSKASATPPIPAPSPSMLDVVARPMDVQAQTLTGNELIDVINSTEALPNELGVVQAQAQANLVNSALRNQEETQQRAAQVQQTQATPVLYDTAFDSDTYLDRYKESTNILIQRPEAPRVNLAPTVSVPAKAQEEKKGFWETVGDVAQRGGNALQGVLYDAANLSGVIEDKVQQAGGWITQATGGTYEQGRSSVEQMQNVFGIRKRLASVNKNLQERAEVDRNTPGIQPLEYFPKVDFDARVGSYAAKGALGADMSGTTELKDVGKEGKSPVGFYDERQDFKRDAQGNYVLDTKGQKIRQLNPTWWMGLGFDVGAGAVAGGVVQASLVNTIGKIAKVASASLGATVGASTKVANTVKTVTNVAIDPLGEALGATVTKGGGALVRTAKAVVKKGKGGAATSIERVASNVDVPKVEVQTTTGKGVVTAAEGSDIVLDNGAKVPLSELKAVDGSTTLPENLVVAPEPNGGVTLPEATSFNRVSIPLEEGTTRRSTNSIRNVEPSIREQLRSFNETQPVIETTSIDTLPPSILKTDVDGVVTTPKSFINYAEGQIELGKEIKLPDITELRAKADLPSDDIPLVDSRVFSGVMEYPSLNYAIAQQVPGTQVDPQAVNQVKRSVDDLVAVGRKLTTPDGEQLLPDDRAFNTYEDIAKRLDEVNASPEMRAALGEYGVPVPKDTLDNAIDYRVRVQEEVPYKQPEGSALVRQEPKPHVATEFDEARYENYKKNLSPSLQPKSLETVVARKSETTEAITRRMFSSSERLASTSGQVERLKAKLNTMEEMLDDSATRASRSPDIGRKYQGNIESLSESPLEAKATSLGVDKAGSLSKSALKSQWFHGTRANLASTVDAVRGGKRAEWGTGFYMTNNPQLATSYAKADISPNLPQGTGRTFGEPSVHALQLQKGSRVLNIDTEPSPAIRELFAEYVPSRVANNAKTVRKLYQALEQRVAKTSTDEVVLRNASEDISRGMRALGYDAVGDAKQLNVLNTQKLETLGVKRVGDVTDPAEIQAHRFNVDSHRAGTQPESLSAAIDFEESSVRLQAETTAKVRADLQQALEEQSNLLQRLLKEEDELVKQTELEQLRSFEAKEQARQLEQSKSLNKAVKDINDPCLP